MRKLVAMYEGESLSIVCTRHILGALLATLSAFDIAVNGMSRVGGADVPVTAIVFRSPQIGNPKFKKRFDELSNLHALHVMNKPDLIPLYPSGLLGYANVGDLLAVSTKKSPYVKDDPTNVGDYHNLQGILHTVAEWNGKDREFKLQVHRSVVLVNKSSAFLQDDNLVPESWWVERNKRLVIGETGLWQLEPPAEENLPVPPAVTGKEVIDDNVAAGPASKEAKIAPAVDDDKKELGTYRN
jgi:hypothetical protein